jgi:hypothetical protein
VQSPTFSGHIDGVDLNCGCPQGFALKVLLAVLWGCYLSLTQ